MSKRVCQMSSQFVIENPFPEFLRAWLAWTDNAPPLGYLCADIRPASRLTVTHIVRFSGMIAFQHEEANPGEIFDMNQIDELVCWADSALFNPFQRITAWTIDAGHAENGGSV